MTATATEGSAGRRQALARQRARSRALLVVLLGLAVLFYAVSMARVSVRMDMAPGMTRGAAP